MEYVPEETEVVWVAVGKTYDIKDDLKSLGFRWNPANKVWYHLGGLTVEYYEFLTELRAYYPALGISFRHFETSDNIWWGTSQCP